MVARYNGSIGEVNDEAIIVPGRGSLEELLATALLIVSRNNSYIESELTLFSPHPLADQPTIIPASLESTIARFSKLEIR